MYLRKQGIALAVWILRLLQHLFQLDLKVLVGYTSFLHGIEKK